MPQEELLKSIRKKRLDVLALASLALKSESYLEYHHLDWLRVR